MLLSYVLFWAAAALVATTDAASALNGATLSNPNVVDLTNAHEIIENDSRFLRTYKKAADVDDEDQGDDDDDERMFSGWMDKGKALAIAKDFLGKSDDQMMAMASKLSKEKLNLLFSQGSGHLQELVPGFVPGMQAHAFMDAVQSSTKLTSGQKDALNIAYLNLLAHNTA